MASEENAENNTEGEKKKGGRKTLIIILILLLLLGGGGAAAFFILKGSGDKTEVSEEEPGGEETAAEGELPAARLPLDSFVVNLKDKNSYLKVTVQLELFEPEVPKTMENDTGKIKDAIITLLSSKSVDDLLVPDGKAKLKTEIVNTVNEALNGEIVAAAYFTEFIIQ